MEPVARGTVELFVGQVQDEVPFNFLSTSAIGMRTTLFLYWRPFSASCCISRQHEIWVHATSSPRNKHKLSNPLVPSRDKGSDIDVGNHCYVLDSPTPFVHDRCVFHLCLICISGERSRKTFFGSAPRTSLLDCASVPLFWGCDGRSLPG